MSVEKILTDWKKKTLSRFTGWKGKKSYYIDQVMDYAEHHISQRRRSGL